MSNNRSNETIAAESITQYWLDEEKGDDTDPFIAKSSEQHDKEMGAAVIEALTAAGRLVAAQGAAPQVIVCDYCGDALPSVPSRAHIPTTPSIQRLGFSADKVVCPECVQRARCAASVLPSSGVDEDKLAEVRREAAEKAWWEACLRIADGESNLDIADTYQKQNPYLEEIRNE